MYRVSLSDVRGSYLDEMQESQHGPAKMSKSRGNCVTVDMCVYGVAEIDPGFEFRDSFNRVIRKWHRCGIWRDKAGDGMFYAGPAFQKRPVLLCRADEIIPSRLVVNGREVMQHPHLFALWDALHAAYPDEFYDTEEIHYAERSCYHRAGVYAKE